MALFSRTSSAIWILLTYPLRLPIECGLSPAPKRYSSARSPLKKSERSVIRDYLPDGESLDSIVVAPGCFTIIQAGTNPRRSSIGSVRDLRGILLRSNGRWSCESVARSSSPTGNSPTREYDRHRCNRRMARLCRTTKCRNTDDETSRKVLARSPRERVHRVQTDGRPTPGRACPSSARSPPAPGAASDGAGARARTRKRNHEHA